MKFVRGLLIAIAFVTFPVALIALADSVLVERDVPELFGSIAREAANDPVARSELADELVEMWLDEQPEVVNQLTAVGLDPVQTLRATFVKLAETPPFLDEFERGATQFGEDLVSGRRPILRLDFTDAIEESKASFDPLVLLAIRDFSMIETMPMTDDEALRLQGGAADIRLYALFGAAISFLLLALLTSSVRHHFGALFLAGMPVLFIQRAILTELGEDPDPVDALIGSLIAETWLPWTHRMMFVSAGALVVLLASYKLMPPSGSSAVPYAKGTKSLPPRPVIINPAEDDSYVFASESDHQSLRALSIVED